MAPELNRFLSPLDAGFLYVERPNETMHIGGCMVYEGEFSREHMIEQVGARMHLLPRYRQRVVFPPFLVSHPLWVDDPDFDIENHIDEVRLPADSNEQVLGRVASEAYSGMLDRDRPAVEGNRAARHSGTHRRGLEDPPRDGRRRLRRRSDHGAERLLADR